MNEAKNELQHAILCTYVRMPGFEKNAPSRPYILHSVTGYMRLCSLVWRHVVS